MVEPESERPPVTHENGITPRSFSLSSDCYHCMKKLPESKAGSPSSTHKFCLAVDQTQDGCL